MPSKPDFSEESKETTKLEKYIKYREMVDELPDPMVVLDDAGFVRYINSAAEKISGYKREDVVGRHFAEIGVVSIESLPKAIKEFALVMAGHVGPPYNLDFRRKDGTHYIVEINHSPIIREGKPIGINLILRYFGEKK